MPNITSPNSFSMKTLHQLAEDHFNAVAHMGQEAWIKLFLVFGRFVGSQETFADFSGIENKKKVTAPFAQ